jgi:hypothetical protein
MIQRMNIGIYLFAAMSLLFMNTTRAADIETLLMPGKVISGHAKYESECSLCHVRFKKGTQSELCRDCHEEIDADMRARRGYHGLGSGIRESDCKSCHTEHIGRDARIVLLNRATFDHHETDFTLEGSHVEIPCGGCHLPQKKYAEAPAACADCHSEQDPHKGKLGEQCHDCHNAESWQTFNFDHGETDFPLQGKHKDVACDSCHLRTRYQNTPKDCHSCHALNDVHDGRNGAKCHDCHSPRRWDRSDFDHDRKTDFALKGKHKTVSCEACHKESSARKKPRKDCYSCHRNDDRHTGRYGKQCDSCHSESSWKRTRFDHGRDTDFPLKGKHTRLSCSACHRGELDKENLSSQCHSCHLGDDVHRGQEGKQCQRCHQESSWSERIVFDHDLTRFPLLGLHLSTPCEECHISAAFKDSDSDCHACHKDDDDHQAALGTECGQCHNPNGWGLWIFEHNRQTDFKLDGGHTDLACSSCHYAPAKSKVRQSQRCAACHQHDDAHRGRFGRNCERCHNTESFRDVTIR